MDLTHQFRVPAGVDETWVRFQDVAGLAGCFPGAQVTSVDGDEFTGSCKVKLGPIALVYNGTGTFTGRDESAHRLVVEAKGRDKRGNGTAAASATVTMTEADGGGTDVEVVTDLHVTGKPAQFGRGLIQEVSDKLLGQFVACLEQQLGPAEVADTTPTPLAGTGSPAGVDAPATEPAAPSAGAGTPAVAPASTPAQGRVDRPAQPSQPEALDLGATVLPVVIRSYWKPALAVVVALALVVRLFKRRARR
ncbi:SRPBCC family protein [Cryptosporangium minutisporangium]|uniref:SRPBCC family protein n=1 Tax=Cryptosporangium minutisporangium TaxID=113569 RepID=A0ABP6T0I2_9ACTN